MRKTTKFLTLVLAVLMIMSVVTTAASAKFTDVSVENEALDHAVELLTTLGIAKGTTETTFGPDELVTRQQMAAFAYRLMKAGKSVEGGDNSTAFTDLEDSTYFYMVSWAHNQGIIKGTSATTFNPKGNITLQDAYVMIVRALGYEKDEVLPYPYGYIDIAESIGLDEDLPSTLNYTDSLSRGNVAIILANAFYADMNEKTVKYVWKYDDEDKKTNAAYVAVETTETVAHKIFGVEEETFNVTATKHYALGSSSALYNETSDVDRLEGTRYDTDDKLIKTGVQFKMSELGLTGSSDDYFLAQLTLFVKKDDKNVDDDKVIAAKSNLVKKTVTSDKVAMETSSKTDAEYYVGGVKKADGDKVMTGYMTFDGVGAYLDIDNAPYSYVNPDNKSKKTTGVEFIDLTDGDYTKDNATFKFTNKGNSFKGLYTKKTNSAGKDSYEGLTTEFEKQFPTVYNKGLYEAEVYDVDGDNYADYIFVKNYSFNKMVIKTNKKFANSVYTGDVPTIYTEEATIKGDFKTDDYVLAYINRAAKLVEVAKVVTPVNSMVKSKINGDDSKTVTLASGDVIEFVDANKKLAGYNGYDISTLAVGKAYKVYTAGGVLLYKEGSGSGNFDTNANYAVVLKYDDTSKTSYYPLTGSSNVTGDKVVNSATGVVNNKFSTYYYVNAIIDGTVKAVKLADYANSYISWDGTKLSKDTEVESQKITKKEVAESVMYYDFLNKISTYTVDADGAYTFSALDIPTTADTSILNDTSDENSVNLTIADSHIKQYTGNIYSITNTGKSDFTRFAMKDYSKFVVKTIDDDGEDVYTVYTAANMPSKLDTDFTNVRAIFVNNKNSNIENLGILFADTTDLKTSATKDYRIITAVQSVLNESNNEKKVVTILDPRTGEKTTNVDVVSTFTNPDNGKVVVLTADGKVDTASIGTSYAENVIFNKSLNDYDEGSKFMTLAGDSNTYIVNADTKILFYTSASTNQMVDASILTNETDNPYIDITEDDKGNTKPLNLYVVAEENDDNTSEDSIKVAKTIIVTDINVSLSASK